MEPALKLLKDFGIGEDEFRGEGDTYWLKKLDKYMYLSFYRRCTRLRCAISLSI